MHLNIKLGYINEGLSITYSVFINHKSKQELMHKNARNSASSPGALIAISCAKYCCEYDARCRARPEDQQEAWSAWQKMQKKHGGRIYALCRYGIVTAFLKVLTRMSVCYLPICMRQSIYICMHSKFYFH